MKYNVGDRVRIKSIDWYNENKDNYGSIYAGNGFCFWKSMARLCGEIMKITSVKVDPEDSNKGYYFMENSEEKWTDEMIEGLVEEETKPKFKVGDKIKLKSTLLNDVFGVIGYESEGYRITNISNGLTYFMSYSIEHYYELVEEEVGLVDNLSSRWVNEFSLPEGYIFKDENGNVINAMKIVLEKKKKEYPKTYEECCEIVKVGKEHTLEGATIRINYKIALLESFQKLLICRDAYWKIAGEEMGLGKPWEPDWDNLSTNHEFIKINKGCFTYSSRVLVFPTAGMRDAFKENFDPDIEICKEFL